MPTLHLTHQGGRLRLRSGRLILTDAEGGVLQSVPARKVRRVVIHGQVGLTTPALVFLLKNDRSIHFVGLRGVHYGTASPASLPDPARINKQLVLSPQRRLDLARSMLTGKVRSQIEYLRRSGLDERLQVLHDQLAAMAAANTLDTLRGMEGMASRVYFESVASELAAFGFYRRQRRPPTDAVNAALSYGYAVVLALTVSALLAADLHPEIGVIHTTGRRKPALALDLMEEFRVPLVEAPLFRAFKRGWIGTKDTRRESSAVLLNDSGKKKVIEALETRLQFKPAGFQGSYQEIVFLQAERLASAIVHEKAYEAYALARG